MNNMQLINHLSEISNPKVPVNEQTETTNRNYKTWQKAEQKFSFLRDINVHLFQAGNFLSQSRRDLFEAGKLVDNQQLAREFWIRVFYWGFTSGGRGNMFINALKNSNRIEAFLLKAKQSGAVSMKQINEAFDKTGMRVSTYSKLLYFLQIPVEGLQPLIFDKKLMLAVTSGPFSKDFHGFEGLSRMGNMNRYYINYLEQMHRNADQLRVTPDELEYFLFTKG